MKKNLTVQTEHDNFKPKWILFHDPNTQTPNESSKEKKKIHVTWIMTLIKSQSVWILFLFWLRRRRVWRWGNDQFSMWRRLQSLSKIKEIEKNKTTTTCTPCVVSHQNQNKSFHSKYWSSCDCFDYDEREQRFERELESVLDSRLMLSCAFIRFHFRIWFPQFSFSFRRSAWKATINCH